MDVNEGIESILKEGSSEILGKLDLEKAYDGVNWYDAKDGIRAKMKELDEKVQSLSVFFYS